MKRNDNDLAFMLKFENIAWYQDGALKILDRRIYPMETRFEICKSHLEVAQAIKDMVTQSEGPYIAAAMGMALAGFEVQQKKPADPYAYLKDAAYTLSHARPTTASQMEGIVGGALEVAQDYIMNNDNLNNLDKVLFEYALNYENKNYARYTIIGEKMAELIPNNGTIMTQCFGGTVVGTMLRACRESGKEIKVICAETRPYYQGSRLTASVACDMGFDVTVITDNMTAYILQNQKIDIFTSASDVITMDGHIINKIGTFQIALACKNFGVPYYCTGTPDSNHKDLSTIHIEERNPELVMMSLDTKITMEGVKGYYPAFDITPAEYCKGIITEKGIYKPTELKKYIEEEIC
jgi:methylthioribose-1-phosphate isomerase